MRVDTNNGREGAEEGVVQGDEEGLEIGPARQVLCFARPCRRSLDRVSRPVYDTDAPRALRSPGARCY